MSAFPFSLDELRQALQQGRVVPYLGPGLLPAGGVVPASPEALAARLTAKVQVPHKIRGRLTAAAQFIENFKHRKTLVALMSEAFAAAGASSPLLPWLAAQPLLPLVVDSWYDGAMRRALAVRGNWGELQGLSQSEHFGTWYGAYDDQGRPVDAAAAGSWDTLLYAPIGAVAPAANYLVSDSDYVEVLTEIDIQTPIPAEVQARRAGRHFLFLGCRFTDQLQRSFARQVMKRSSARHWAVLPEVPSRNELRFLEEQGIERLAMPLEEFATWMTGTPMLAREAERLPAPEQLAGSLAS